MQHPIDTYVEALEAQRKGDGAAASQKLSQALGAEEVTQPIKGATDKMLTPGTPAHDVALGLLSFQVEKNRKGKDA